MNNRPLNAENDILIEINSRLRDSAEPATNTMDVNGVIKRIGRAVFEVSRELGSGFLEPVYENALMVELKKEGLKARHHVPIKVRYKGFPVGEYYAHIIVEDQVVLELKMVDELQKVHKKQLINCLKATGYGVGLLINFANEKAEIRQFFL
jgi:GxxExxY protein